jgi:hypothetical protein
MTDTKAKSDPQVEYLEFGRIHDGSFYHGKHCEECFNVAEFEYGIWFTHDRDVEPDQTGILCGTCAAVILVQETASSHVLLEKDGEMVRAVR